MQEKHKTGEGEFRFCSLPFIIFSARQVAAFYPVDSDFIQSLLCQTLLPSELFRQ